MFSEDTSVGALLQPVTPPSRDPSFLSGVVTPTFPSLNHLGGGTPSQDLLEDTVVDKHGCGSEDNWGDTAGLSLKPVVTPDANEVDDDGQLLYSILQHVFEFLKYDYDIEPVFRRLEDEGGFISFLVEFEGYEWGSGCILQDVLDWLHNLYAVKTVVLLNQPAKHIFTINLNITDQQRVELEQEAIAGYGCAPTQFVKKVLRCLVDDVDDCGNADPLSPVQLAAKWFTQLLTERGFKVIEVVAESPKLVRVDTDDRLTFLRDLTAARCVDDLRSAGCVGFMESKGERLVTWLMLHPKKTLQMHWIMDAICGRTATLNNNKVDKFGLKSGLKRSLSDSDVGEPVNKMRRLTSTALLTLDRDLSSTRELDSDPSLYPDSPVDHELKKAEDHELRLNMDPLDVSKDPSSRLFNKIKRPAGVIQQSTKKLLIDDRIGCAEESRLRDEITDLEVQLKNADEGRLKDEITDLEVRLKNAQNLLTLRDREAEEAEDRLLERSARNQRRYLQELNSKDCQIREQAKKIITLSKTIQILINRKK